MSETSNNTELFLNLLESEKASNLDDAKKKLKQRFASEIPNTVFEYMEQNNIPYDQAIAELKAKGVQLGQITSDIDFTSGLPGVTAAAYDSVGTGSRQLEVVDGRVVAKNRPEGLARLIGGVLDIATIGAGDFDQRGGFFGGKTTGLGYNIDKGLESGRYNQTIRPEGVEKLLDLKVKKELPNVEISPLGELINDGSSSSSGTKDGNKTILDKYQDFQQKQKDFERKNRRKDALEATVGQVIQTPIYTRLIEDAAKRRLELDKAMLGAREMMPSNIQNIMLSKQAQKQMASSAFAEEAKALAAQQDAATNFAGLGMQRKFG
jgi:hypothetical protein